MITSIQGRVAQTTNDTVTVIVGGVGVQVIATRVAVERSRDAANSEAEVFMHTRLIVREDALMLYGFAAEAERDLFDMLIKVTGVGPRLATTILSTMTVDNLRNAVVTERSELLTRVPGIGKKTAQKIVFELKSKMPVGLGAAPVMDDDVNSDVMDALIGLGFSVVEAQTAVQALPADAPDDVQERIRLSLQYLSG
jgi:holliday junction DNA helicase RuvA